MMNITYYSSPLGQMLLAEKGGALVGAWFAGQKYFPYTGQCLYAREGAVRALDEAGGWLDRYFNGGRPSLDELTLAPEGSAFRRAVWEILCSIPYGQLMTYGEIAHKLAEDKGYGKMSAQAVGGAVGHNPISVIIPCHRVVGSSGSLTGYAGGVERKRRLLSLEGADMSGLFVPRKARTSDYGQTV